MQSDVVVGTQEKVEEKDGHDDREDQLPDGGMVKNLADHVDRDAQHASATEQRSERASERYPIELRKGANDHEGVIHGPDATPPGFALVDALLFSASPAGAARCGKNDCGAPSPPASSLL